MREIQKMIIYQAFRYDGNVSRRDMAHGLMFNRMTAKIHFALISNIHLNVYKMVSSRINE